MNKDRLAIMTAPIIVLGSIVLTGLSVWLVIAGVIAANLYSLEPFLMDISEWDGYFRALLFLYALFSIAMMVGVIINVPDELKKYTQKNRCVS